MTHFKVETELVPFMKIRTLVVHNFRAIASLELRNLGCVVIIAGPNGCGKSCVFDAIRLLKSVYGGYQPNEVQNWFGEFQINVNQEQENLLRLFQDRRRAMDVTIEIELAADEKSYLQTHCEKLLADRIWSEIEPQSRSTYSIGAMPLAANLRAYAPAVTKRLQKELPVVMASLDEKSHTRRITIQPDGKADVK